jgi:competence protein ComEC
MPLLWLSLAFLAGLVLGTTSLEWRVEYWLGLGAACLLLWPVLRKIPAGRGLRDRLRWLGVKEARLMVPPILLAGFVLLGAGRMAAHGPDPASGHVARFNDGGRVRIQAVVVGDPDRRDSSTLLRLAAEQVIPLAEDGSAGEPQAAHGYLMAYLPGRAPWQYGDRLLLDGLPETPPENDEFSYRDFLVRKDVYTYLTFPRIRLVETGAGNPVMAAIYGLREQSYRKVFELFPAPEAPLLAGILLGLERDISEEMAQAFRDTGTAHIIAISGFNIAILAQLFSNLFGKVFSRWWAMTAAILAVFGYTLLVGAAASVTRAAIMGSLALVAQQIGRRSTGVNSLALTAAIMSLFNPHLPWDPSFQLSFTATLGLMVYGDRFQGGFTRWLERKLPAQTAKKVAAPVGEYVLLTMAAQVMTLPVILYHFQRLSVSSLLANPLILPAQPLVMILGGLAVIAGLVSEPLGHLLAALAWPLPAYTIRVVELMGQIKWGVVALGEFNLATIGLMYAAVFAPVLGDKLSGVKKAFLQQGLLVIGIGLAAAFLWRGVLHLPDGHLRLTVYEMNGSQAVLLQAPDGQQVLINGGPSTRLLNDVLGRQLSPLDRRLDALLLTSAHSSSLSSLPRVLEGYPASAAWWGSDPPKNRAGDRLQRFLRRQKVETRRLAAGDALALGPEARVEVLASDPQGSALLVRWRSFRALLPGGIEPRYLRAEDIHHAGVLVLEARDLEKTTPEDWLAYQPQAVVFVGGSSDLPESWLVPRPQGWISVTTDGFEMRVETK